eukprot:CAMPEP_0202956834 /NCGR_PEP_ID=MMETSP1396-20130829/1327_1 /ASSEMBLY_ACC=CAM_ASM_000872 /TAXON_ID= /ORGANISM="Pseudokeronopsis sp., Strain Brazil" /LENGTH=65 /DNA_ID=CAMNT_0049674035 /DNA_START=96 /DNA_END=293 /DNA_ORIENTATION=+
MLPGPFTRIPGRVAAKQIAFAALKGATFALSVGLTFKIAVMDNQRGKIAHHYDVLRMKIGDSENQ